MRRYLPSIVLFVFISLPAFAQEEAVTLILQNGEKITCTVLDIWRGTVRFEATTSKQAFKYGEFIEIEKIAQVEFADGQQLSRDHFLALWQEEESEPDQKSQQPNPPPPPVVQQQRPAPESPPNPPVYGTGLKVNQLPVEPEHSSSGIGLRLPEIPQSHSGASAVDYDQLGDLLAESGMAGKLLYQVSAGDLKDRNLTESQRQLVDALLQSRAWAVRKRDLHDAHRRANAGFEHEYDRNSFKILSEFKFEAIDRTFAFLEFIQFLYTENAHRFLNKWRKLEEIFNEETTLAIRDILNNYDDWYYLFGQELERFSGK